MQVMILYFATCCKALVTKKVAVQLVTKGCHIKGNYVATIIWVLQLERCNWAFKSTMVVMYISTGQISFVMKDIGEGLKHCT